MADIYDTNIFDSFLDGNLSSSELKDFKIKLKNDAAFAKAFEEHKELLKGIQLVNEQKTQSTLNSAKDELEREGFFEHKNASINKKPLTKDTKVVGFLRIISVAAAGLLLIGVSYFLIKNGSTDITPNDLYAEFYQPENSIIPSILDRLEAQGFSSIEKVEKEGLKVALKHYEEENYKEAQAAFDNFQKKFPNNKIANFYDALTLLELNNFYDASTILDELSSDPEFEFTHAATWYSALAYSQLGTTEDTAKSFILMKKLASEDVPPFSKQAKHFIKKLNK